MKTIVLIDGHNAAWRLVQKVPVLTTVSGQPTQIVYGMLRLVRSVLDQFTPDFALVCWDSGVSAARRKIFPQYKANRGYNYNEAERKEHEYHKESLAAQIRTLRSVLNMVNVAQMSYPDTEADDLIGIACRELADLKKTVISTDGDMLQLVDRETQVWSPGKLELFTEKNFKEKIGLSPAQYLQMRVLTGDTSDGIPGVAKGFGEASAKELLLKYGNLDQIFCTSTEKKMLTQGGRQMLLCAEGVRERAARNMKLMDLQAAAAINKDLPEICKLLHTGLQRRKKINKMELLTYFKKNEFKSLLQDMVTWLQPFENLHTEG